MKQYLEYSDTTFPVLRIRGVFVPKNRVLQARITDDTHEKLTEKCSELGCSITDYVIGVLDNSFEEENQDLKIQVEEINEPSNVRTVGKVIKVIPIPTIEIMPELRNIRVIND